MDIKSVVSYERKPTVSDARPGDTVKVSLKVIEGDRERIQVFQGVVLKIRRGGVGANVTVRRISHGVGVERTFMLYSPRLEKVEVLRRGDVRRAKLYYLRGLSGKAARIREKVRARGVEVVEAGAEGQQIGEEGGAEEQERQADETEGQPQT
ncbi:MAG: 50S ribosomal protein L19 [Chloroflexi bacterium]|nr:50S ribosomal protein L19 [Chloroflexota bacterium]